MAPEAKSCLRISAGCVPVDARSSNTSFKARDAVDANADPPQILDAALLPVEQHDRILDHQPGGAEQLDRTDDAAAGCDHVLDNDDTFARLPMPFDFLAEAVALALLAIVDEGDAGGQETAAPIGSAA